MLNQKRLGISTILGFIAGFLSLWWMRAAYGALPMSAEAMVVFSWAVLGFAIGLSAWRINWALHGIFLGVIFSLPQDFAYVWNGGGAKGFWTWLVTGLVVGFLIELITSAILHERREMYPTQTPQPHVGG